MTMPRGIFPGSTLPAGLCLAAAAFSACATDAERAPAPIVVTLKTRALVHERLYALGDVADVAGGDADVVRRLKAVRLGKSPRLGYTEQLTSEEIRRLVRMQFAGPDEQLLWEGGKAVAIETAAVPYDGRRIVETAVDHLRNALSQRYERVEIHPVEAAPFIRLPAGEVSLKPRELAPAKPQMNRVAVWVDIALDGEFYRSVIVPLRLEIPGPAMAARRALPPGHVAMPEDFEWKQLDLAALGAEAAAPETAFGRRLKRPLAAGEVLLQASLEESFAVSTGDVVTLQWRNGAVQIESQALALSAGAVGQIVKIKPGASDAVVLAEVVSPGVVKLSSRQR
jgi:flagella basal body P-ring formation protein FlgA